MKNFSFFLVAAAIATSCIKANLSEPGHITFNASIEDSKVCLGEGGITTWESTDKISVFNGTSSADFQLVSGAGTTSASFSGTIASADSYCAFYPASAISNPWKLHASYENAPVSYYILPGVQEARKGGLPLDAMMAVSTSTDHLEFRHLNSAFRFTIDSQSPAIRSVKVVSDAVIAGKWMVNYVTGASSNVTGSGNALKEITLNSPDGNALEPGDYYITVAAKKLNSSKIAFSFESVTGQVATFSINEGVTAEAGKYYNLGVVRADFSSSDTYNVGDIFPSTGVPEGIVFEIGAGYVKILSLDEKSLAWCSAGAAGASVVAGKRDSNNGEANSYAITELGDYSAANYPALAFCFGKGEGWYLPSSNEVLALLNNANLLTEEGVSAFSAKIVAAGGTALKSAATARYWTSNENSTGSQAYYGYKKSDGTAAINLSNKTTSRGTRAVKKVAVPAPDKVGPTPRVLPNVAGLISKSSHVASFTSSSTLDLADGVKKTEVTLTLTGGLKEKFFVITVDSRNPDVRMSVALPDDMISAPTGAWPRQNLTQMAQAIENKGQYKVLAMTNADFWNTTTLVPRGPIHKSGTIVKTEFDPQSDFMGVSFVGVTADGEMRIYPKTHYFVHGGALRDVTGGGMLLVYDGEMVDNSHRTDRNPRTCIGYTPDGFIHLMVVDGRSTVSEGATYEDLSYLMKALNCWRAVNLDGGGSSQMLYRDPSTESLKIANVPSDGTQRSVVNGWAVTTMK